MIISNKKQQICEFFNYSNNCLVLLSSYNGEKYIKEQIISIINQKDVFTSIVVRDDGSKDGTVVIVNDLMVLYPNRIKLIIGSNVGIHSSFADLMNIVTQFDFVAFSDQDDIWDDNKLIVAISAMKENHAEFYSCASRLIDPDGIMLFRDTSNLHKYKHYMSNQNAILTPGAQGCTMVITKRLYEKVQSHGIPNNIGHDTWIPIVSYYCFNSIYDTEAHMSYRQHDASWTGNRKNRLKHFFTDSRHFFDGMKRYSILAKDFLERFSNEIDPDTVKVLESFTKNNNFRYKRFVLSKYKISKYGTLENIFFKLYYLFVL